MPVALRMLSRKGRIFLRLPAGDQALFWFAYGLLGVSRLAMATLPFRRIAPWLGDQIEAGGCSFLLDAAQIRKARRIGRMVRLAARYTPWESKCLVQAMAARVLLARQQIPCVLYLGVSTRDISALQAHAWVSAGPVYVTGEDGFPGFTVVSAFFSHSRR